MGLSIFKTSRKTRAYAPETKSAPLIALSLMGAPRWSARDFATLAREGAMGNAIAPMLFAPYVQAFGLTRTPWLALPALALLYGIMRAFPTCACHTLTRRQGSAPSNPTPGRSSCSGRPWSCGRWSRSATRRSCRC